MSSRSSLILNYGSVSVSGGWNFAEVWETIAQAIPGEPAVVQGEVRRSWADFDRRADGVAACLLGAGLGRQDKVAQYLHNGPAYLESVFAAFKAALVPVNTNYRYLDDELVYLWDNADVVAVVFDTAFTERVEAVRDRVPAVRAWIGVGPECPGWAVPYEQAAASASGRVEPEWGRSPDDLYLLYTGGTTGLPKGVMWRVDDVFSLLNATAAVSYPDLASVPSMVREGSGLVGLPASPLMHGSAAFTAFSILDCGGPVVLLEGKGFDAEELLAVIERERVSFVGLVGDAFAKPLLDVLDRSPDRWDISSLEVIVSSGVMWSEITKEGLLRHRADLQLVDAFASSEAPAMGVSVAGARTASFELGEHARVIDDAGRDVAPGSGVVGRVAVGGRLPLGYYKDEEKTAATFAVIDGIRYSIPGDFATVESDGTLRLLGRGSLCINSGGEKVFPEEVEEALKEHERVTDAVVVGVDDDRLGQAVAAVVSLRSGSGLVGEAALIAHVKARLASYKAPKRIVFVDDVGRAPNGKADYERLRALVTSVTSGEA